MIVYISIGNSDDKLSQREWAKFQMDLMVIITQIRNVQIHGRWYSAPDDSYQNMCVCVQLPELYSSAPEIYIEGLQEQLKDLAHEYRQESISWAVVEYQEFLEPEREYDGDSTP